MNYFKILVLIFLSSNVSAQSKPTLLNKSIQVDIGAGRHGTGDMDGYSINTEYRKYFRSKLSFTLGLGATIHDGFFPYGGVDSTGRIRDITFRYAAAGLQFTSKAGYSFVKNKANDFGVQIGVLLRYQTSSYYDQLTFLNPVITGLPVPVLIIVNESPQRTFSIGGIMQLFYYHSISANLFVGGSGGLQTDTNGDTITQIALSFGMRF